jgi:uncharacterized membrane protein
VKENLEETIWMLYPTFSLGWNLTLAAIPLILSIFLFNGVHGKKPTGIWWWVVFTAFICFLPNAPYVITDMPHFLEKLNGTIPVWRVNLLLIEFFCYSILGMSCFVISMLLWEKSFKKRGLSFLAVPTEIATIAICSLGVYLGRVERLNSWDIITNTKVVFLKSFIGITDHHAQARVVLFFIVLSSLYYSTKFLLYGGKKILSED